MNGSRAPAPCVERPASVRANLAALVLLASLGCGGGDGGGGVGPPKEITVHVAGRLERSGTVALNARLDGVAIPPSELTWTAEPASAVEFLSNEEAKLLSVGSVTLTASASGRQGSGVVTIVAPPSVLLDQVVDGNRDIYSVAIDGGDRVRLTTNAGDDRDAASSATEIWFTSYRNGNGELYRMPLTGGAELRVTTSAPAEEREIAFRPGTTGEMAYTSNASGVAKLWRASDVLAPAPAAPAFGYSGSIDAGPSWSSDGTVVFMSTAGGAADLYQLTNGTVDPIEVGDTPNFEPAFRSDGSRIVFGSSRGGSAKLYIYDVVSRAVTPLTTGTGDDAQSTWLADGRIVFTSWRSGSAKLYWVDPADRDVVHEIPTGGTDPQRASAR